MMTVQQAFALAVQHHGAGRLAEAEALYRQILAAQPKHAEAWHRLGVLACQAGRTDAGVEWIRQSVNLDPGNPSAHANLGLALLSRQQFEEAIAACRRALHLDPNYVEAYFHLGRALDARGQTDEAIAAYRKVLALKPDDPGARNNLGTALRCRGQLDEAVAVYRAALELDPNQSQIQNNLGIVLTELGQLDAAVSACRRALTLDPNHPEIHNNLGTALAKQGRLDEALASYQRALELEPRHPGIHGNLGGVLKEQGKIVAAVAAYRHALALHPEDAELHSNLLYTLHFLAHHDARVVSEEHQRWNQQFSAPVQRFIQPHRSDRDPERRLRVGYVSPDFREHVVGQNVLPLFTHHHHRDFEIVCYSGTRRPDRWTDDFRRRAAVWRNTAGVTDAALAEMIRVDGVDVLVDLTQHMAGNRLPVFARQPAPVQVSFAGYPESAGVEAIIYRISDRYLEAEVETSRKERVFLIDSFWCYDSCGMDVKVNDLPAKAKGSLAFGSLNSFSKVNEPLLKLWARVLREVSDSRLVLLSGLGSHRQQTVEFLMREGVEAGQVEFVERCSRHEYFALYHRLDIVLDTFPYNGHTTSLDALWMGVPVVGLAGERPVSRAGLSQLSSLGLPELVARSEDEYVEIAAHLARDLPRLAELRRTLRARMEASVLMDAPRFARNIEAAYRAMWRQWCAEKS